MCLRDDFDSIAIEHNDGDLKGQKQAFYMYRHKILPLMIHRIIPFTHHCTSNWHSGTDIIIKKNISSEGKFTKKGEMMKRKFFLASWWLLWLLNDGGSLQTVWKALGVAIIFWVKIPFNLNFSCEKGKRKERA